MINAGVEPITIGPEEKATSEAPKSLLTNCKLEEFPESQVIFFCMLKPCITESVVFEVMPPGNISWAPPMQNWNAWRASNIDEPPLAFVSSTGIFFSASTIREMTFTDVATRNQCQAEGNGKFETK